MDSLDIADNLVIEPNIDGSKLSKEFQNKIIILPPKNLVRAKNEPEKNIYN